MSDTKTTEDQLTRVGKTQFLVAYTFYEVHESEPIDANAREIIEAVANLDMRDDKIANFMLGLRELPSKVLDRFRNTNGVEKNRISDLIHLRC